MRAVGASAALHSPTVVSRMWIFLQERPICECTLPHALTMHRGVQNELAIARGDAARVTTDLELAKAEQHVLQRNKELSSSALEANITEMQRNTAELLAEKADLQNQLRTLQCEKCQLSAQIDTLQQDLNTGVSLRKCIDSKLASADNRAEKAETELAAVHRANVDMNLRITRLQAENAQLRERNTCAHFYFMHSWLQREYFLAVGTDRQNILFCVFVRVFPCHGIDISRPVDPCRHGAGTCCQSAAVHSRT